ncbi:MAG: hypothetical protein ACRDI2_10210 [Chloroflexota bacterium]
MVTVAAVWLPLAADFTPANAAELPPALRFLLGDASYHDPELDGHCAAAGLTLVATRRGRRRTHDPGREVRRVFHQLRSCAIEHCNGQFKAIFDARRPVPTRGLVATRRWVLGAVLVCQLLLLHRFETGRPLRTGLKPCLLAA